ISHADDQRLYDEMKARHLNMAETFKKSRTADDVLFDYAAALGPRGTEMAKRITDSGQIVFHAIGDTGSVKSTRTQNAVADSMTADYYAPVAAERPSFYYH